MVVHVVFQLIGYVQFEHRLQYRQLRLIHGIVKMVEKVNNVALYRVVQVVDQHIDEHIVLHQLLIYVAIEVLGLYQKCQIDYLILGNVLNVVKT